MEHTTALRLPNHRALALTFERARPKRATFAKSSVRRISSDRYRHCADWPLTRQPQKRRPEATGPSRVVIRPEHRIGRDCQRLRDVRRLIKLESRDGLFKKLHFLTA